METKQKQWLMIEADYNPSFCALKTASQKDLWMSDSKHLQME